MKRIQDWFFINSDEEEEITPVGEMMIYLMFAAGLALVVLSIVG